MRQLKITKQITNRETQSLDSYLQEIGRVSLITADEEVELARGIKAGDQRALEKMVNANLRFVVSVAKQYQNNGLSLSDLINEGNIGLIKAALRFDETRGFKFISYAVWWIRQSIMQALAEQARIVRLPLNRVGTLSRINRTMAELEQKYQREPSLSELSEVLDISMTEIEDTIGRGARQISVHAPLGSGEDNNLLDILQDESERNPDTHMLQTSLRTDISRSLLTLSSRESDILKLYFGLDGEPPLSMEEIGQKFNLTRERVRQVKEKAIRRLRSTARSGLLKAYLG